VLSPDAAYVSPKVLKGLTKAELAGFPHLSPDFVIELLSASDSLVKTQEKMDRWIENGAQLGWLIDPYAKKRTSMHRVSRSRLSQRLLSREAESSRALHLIFSLSGAVTKCR
jgi:Uma2 family endonuclease